VRKLNLTFACGGYDRMGALYDGTVQVEGAELAPIVLDDPMECFSRMLNGEFDVSEMSLSRCFIMRANRSAKFAVLPVFPSRMFRHGFIFLNRRTISKPKDLAGKRIGVRGYQMTAAVWIRGILRENGVSLDDVKWFEGGVNESRIPGGSGLNIHPDKKLDIQHIARDKTLSEMLARGEIDALIGHNIPDSFGKCEDVIRLFPDYPHAERESYKRTGIFPIMHGLVIREDLHRSHPWLATSLYNACDAAKSLAQVKARNSHATRFMLPWLREHLDELDEVFGSDPWPYGVSKNLETLNAFHQLLLDDGFLSAPIALDDVFARIGGAKT
jgi:4,5-dihydroxyphthalate decarboxylase